MSGGAGESYATIMTSFDRLMKYSKKDKDMVFKMVEENFKRFHIPKSITDIKKMSKEELKKDKVAEKIFMQDQIHKQISQQLEDLMKKNKGLRENIVLEAMSGDTKFDGGSGTANYLLALDEGGFRWIILKKYHQLLLLILLIK